MIPELPEKSTNFDLPPLPEEPPDVAAPLSKVWSVENGPFQILGYDHGAYYYIPDGTRQVVELTPAAHNRQNLLALAPRSFWEKRFMNDETKRIAWELAANALLRKCERRGVYDPCRIRGRGAWEDAGRSVLHLGDRMIVDGQQIEVGGLDSAFVYEMAPGIEAGVDATPLSTPEAHRFAALCDLPSWETGIFGRLLAGWCVLAPVCGALSWRPHIWITGAAGTGKTWVADNIVRPAIGPIGIHVQGATTEAGLRQYLKHDARPVLFDEAEGETSRAAGKVQAVLELMRQASSETGAAIIKGSSGGRAQTYLIRIAACLASIVPGAVQAADVGRISVLTLGRNCNPDATAQFDHLRRTAHELLTPSWTAALRARTVRLIPCVKKNAETFARAVAGHLGNARAGDQLGTLLAGAYSLYSSGVVDEKTAITWVQSQAWGDLAPTTISVLADEARCLSRILERVITVDAGRGRGEMSIGEAVGVVSGQTGGYDGLDLERIGQALGRFGVKVRNSSGDLLISNNHCAIASTLADSPWPKNWDTLLLRLPGAAKAGAVYFTGSTSRAVAVPLATVFPALED